MQTFLPYPDFNESAKVLDPSRLGNQAYREGRIILNGGWKNHPASRIWSENRRALAEYILACFKELENRGRCYQKHIEEVTKIRNELPDNGMPWWLGDDRLHSSHRSNLLKKLPEWYSKFGWTEPNNLPYYWPQKNV